MSDDAPGFREARDRRVGGAACDRATRRDRAARRRPRHINPMPVRVGMTDWNLGQRGDITQDRARARDRARRHPGQRAVPDRREDADAARSEDAGRVQARRARQRHPDLLARHRHAGQVAAADAHQSGLRDPARRGRGDRPQPRHQQHPAADSRRQPHRHDEPGAGGHVRRDDEGGGALRGEVRRGRRPRRLDLGRGQHQAPGCDRLGLRRRLLRRAQHRAAA